MRKLRSSIGTIVIRVLGVLLLFHAVAFTQEVTRPTLRSRFNLPTREESQAIQHALLAGAGVYICRDGTILMPGKDISLLTGYAHAVLKRNDHYSLVDAYDGVTEYGRISEGGVITLNSNEKTDVQQSATPTQWPMDTGGQLKLTSSNFSVIASRVIPCNTSSRPPGAIGCAVLLNRDRLLRIPEADARPENVLWIIRLEGGGFQLEHSGPLYKGTYLTVAPDQTMTFGIGFVGDASYQKKQRYWPDLDATDASTVSVFLPIGYPTNALGEDTKYRALWKNNKPISVSVPNSLEKPDEH